MNHRQRKFGGGPSVYIIHNSLHYKVQKELQLGGDCDSLFIEIVGNSIN